MRALRRRAPRVPVLYVSDTGATPYGKLPPEALAARMSKMVEAMAAEGAVAVVVACNAASTVLGTVDRPPVPVFGVIESALGLVPASFRGVLGVVGGARTIRSGVYRKALVRRGRIIVSRIAQPLSGHIEEGTVDSAECRAALDRIFFPLRDADAILLACTHYPAIAAAIQARAPRARLLDPAEALVERVLHAALLPEGRSPIAFSPRETRQPCAPRRAEPGTSIRGYALR